VNVTQSCVMDDHEVFGFTEVAELNCSEMVMAGGDGSKAREDTLEDVTNRVLRARLPVSVGNRVSRARLPVSVGHTLDNRIMGPSPPCGMCEAPISSRGILFIGVPSAGVPHAERDELELAESFAEHEKVATLWLYAFQLTDEVFHHDPRVEVCCT
jgi:hypothetical protein